ncbi:MAG: hypothetical protein U5M23_10145 [Marinagarivorans sp.]|nr:hypothetical protein [Marinagarivorans sp.]
MTINNISQLLVWPTLLAAGGLLEILYFYLIHQGTIKSNLVDTSDSSPDNTLQ